MEKEKSKDNILRFIDKCEIKKKDIDDDYKLKENFIKMREISTAECIFVIGAIYCSILYYEVSKDLHDENLSDSDQLQVKIMLWFTTACSFLSSM